MKNFPIAITSQFVGFSSMSGDIQSVYFTNKSNICNR
jgi:hypothetical protein